MIEGILVVLSRATPGEEYSYNDWYSHIHLHDALRFRGSIAAQRFKLCQRQIADYKNPSGWQGLALYEVSDAARFTQEHMDAMNTPRMHIAAAFDNSVAGDYYYFPIHFIDNAPSQPIGGNVVLQQIEVKPGSETAFRKWYGQEILFNAAALPGVRSAALMEYGTLGRMFSDPVENFVAIYRLSDPRAMDTWDGPKAVAASALVETKTLATSWWEPILPRLTKDAVLNPTSALLADEEKARAHMGKKYLNLPPFPLPEA
jgi:hypothetical protein